MMTYMDNKGQPETTRDNQGTTSPRDNRVHVSAYSAAWTCTVVGTSHLTLNFYTLAMNREWSAARPVI